MKTIHSCLMILLMITVACKKEVKLTPVPAYLQQMIPYQNGQSIGFGSSTGGVITAIVEKTVQVSEHSNCQNCPVTERIESFDYKLRFAGNRFIDMAVDNRPVIFLTIWSPEINFQLGSGLDFQVTNGSAQFDCGGPRQNCLPSITLNGTTFNNVLEVLNPGSTIIPKAYYTIDKGVVGFICANGVTYHRLP